MGRQRTDPAELSRKPNPLVIENSVTAPAIAVFSAPMIACLFVLVLLVTLVATDDPAKR